MVRGGYEPCENVANEAGHDRDISSIPTMMYNGGAVSYDAFAMCQVGASSRPGAVRRRRGSDALVRTAGSLRASVCQVSASRWGAYARAGALRRGVWCTHQRRRGIETRPPKAAAWPILTVCAPLLTAV